MKKLISRRVSALGVTAIIMIWPATILAAPANHIVISEIQTGSVTDASQEFIELYNPTNSSISLDGWTVDYASSSGASWTKKTTLSGAIPAYGFFLISTAGYVSGDTFMSAGLAGAGGHVRIKDANSTVVDIVGWGSASKPEGSASAAPIPGGSIERIPGRLSDAAGNGEDADNNADDFVLREVSEPQRVASSIEDPGLVPPETPVDPPDADPVVTPIYLPVYITEVLPDPASPLTDAKDEYIELYNPNDVPVILVGYTIRTGSDYRSYYTIGDKTIAPGVYLSFYSADTSLGLTNSGGAVQILDPLGNVLDVTSLYSTAKTGQAWAELNGLWAWTLEPTPGSANILLEPVPKLVATTTKRPASTKRVVAKKTATKKKATAKKKASKAAAKKPKSKVPKTGIAAATQAIADPSPLARWLLIAAGCFTIGYAIYGFRHDLYNYYIKARRNITTWLQDRPALPWRRDD